MKRTGQYYGLTIEDPGNPGTEILIGCMTAHELEKTLELIEATCFDATDYNDYLVGTQGGNGSVNGYYNDQDAGQALITAIMDSKATASFTIAGQATGDVEIKGDMYITSFNRGFELNTPASFTLAYTVAGAITEGTVGP